VTILQDELSKRAMLFSVSAEMALGGDRKNTKATNHIQDHYGVGHGQAKAVNALINQKAPEVLAIKNAYQRIKNTVRKFTTPYKGTNLFVLPSKAYPHLKEALVKDVSNWNDCVADYVNAYPRLKRQREIELGPLFNEMQYPSAENLSKLFAVHVKELPFPRSGDFLADISAEAMEEVKKKIEEDHKQIVQSALDDLVSRMEEKVAHFVDKISNFQPKKDKNDKQLGTFKEATIENVFAIAQLVDTLNFTNDPEIAALSSRCRILGQLSGIKLREDENGRKKAVKDAQSILHEIERIKREDKEIREEVDNMNELTVNDM
jgi:hypothetical protein